MKKNIKQFTELKKWLKYVPNSLTLCNSLCGFASIIVALSYNNEQVLKEIPLVAEESVPRLTFGQIFLRVLRKLAMVA